MPMFHYASSTVEKIVCIFQYCGKLHEEFTNCCVWRLQITFIAWIEEINHTLWWAELELSGWAVEIDKQLSDADGMLSDWICSQSQTRLY